MNRLKERVRQVEARRTALQQTSQHVGIYTIVIRSAETGAVLETWQAERVGWKCDGEPLCS